jgi:hypothetical protein
MIRGLANEPTHQHFLFSFLATVQAQPQTFSSGDKQVNIIELYTSEGCSSCRPAEKWLNTFKDDPRLWNEIIPLAFHVDYWDYIGWSDRFADAKFSDRQRYYAFSNQVSGVYTPGVMLNGREWRGWYYDKPVKQHQKTNGTLSLSLGGEHLDIRFDSNQQDALLNINIAVLGFDLKTEVKRGENHGRELMHDFVVLGHKQLRMSKYGNSYKVSSRLPNLKVAADKLAVVAWVNKSKDLTPLQATGGWLSK